MRFAFENFVAKSDVDVTVYVSVTLVVVTFKNNLFSTISSISWLHVISYTLTDLFHMHTYLYNIIIESATRSTESPTLSTSSIVSSYFIISV